MKISLSWLKEHLVFDFSPEELARKLSSLGFEVSGVEKKGPCFSGVIAAQILEIDKHPNADRLSVCKVTDGTSKLTIVCGAKNILVGQKVPLARIGADLPGGVKISRSKIRGVESFGMICSAEELGVHGPNGGILPLDAGTVLGSDVALTFGESDAVFDIEVMPNRPDCLSHLGLARELSVSLGLPLNKTLGPDIPAGNASRISLHIESPADCPVYVGRLIENVVVGPSPAWLVKKLEAVGMKSINNVVDATNYVMMDIGQPLHAFDADVLEGHEIHVRQARAGETLTTLDDRFFSLNPEILVIADSKNPRAIAGVMGGLDGAVLSKTKRVFLESARFNPVRIRKASQALRIKSESSYRFERGVDAGLVELASQKAAALILSLSGNLAQATASVGEDHTQKIAGQIAVSAQKINCLLGASFDSLDIERVLSRLAFGGGAFQKNGDIFLLTPPSYRSDLTAPSDLAEEVARILGYDQIPSKTSSVVLRVASQTQSSALVESLRSRLKESGFYEAYNYDFVSPKDLSLCGMSSENCPRLANPLSDEFSVLRPTLLAGLLKNASLNFNRGNLFIRLFEIGAVFGQGGERTSESTRLAGVLTGKFPEVYWKSGRALESDFYGALGLLMDSLSGFSLETSLFSESSAPMAWAGLFHPSASVTLKAGGGPCGVLGVLHPRAARAWNLSQQEILLFELDLSVLNRVDPRPIEAKPLNPFPVSWRDISILLKDGTPYGRVAEAIVSCEIMELRRVELADLFSGGNVPMGLVSMTLRLTFGKENGTLTDHEIETMISKILLAIEQKVGARLRQ